MTRRSSAHVSAAPKPEKNGMKIVFYLGLILTILGVAAIFYHPPSPIYLPEGFHMPVNSRICTFVVGLLIMLFGAVEGQSEA